MYVSETSMDLYLLENYPHKFISLYSQTPLQEGMIGSLKKVLADVTKNIGLNLKKSGIDIKMVIGDIRKEISRSKSLILNHLRKGDSFEASNELNEIIDRIWFKIREFYKSRGILGKSILTLLFVFIFVMTLLLIVWLLIHHAIVFILLLVFVPVIITLIKIALSIIKFKYKSETGFPEHELNKSIIKTSEKLGVKNELIVNFLSSTTKKATNKLQRDFDSALAKKTADPKSAFTIRAILMVVKTIKDQTRSGNF